MIRILSLLMLSFAVGLFAACGDEAHDHDKDGHHGDGDHDDAGHADDDDHGHGEERALGSSDVGSHKVTVALLGNVTAGHEAVLDIEIEGDAPDAVRAWVGTESGAGSLKAKVEAEDGDYHGHVEVPDPLPEGSAIWIELQSADGSKTRGSFAIPEDAHGHGNIGPHDGMVASFGSPATKSSGHLELKLHDDKGDLELWLATDEGITQPFDLVSTAEISVTFESHDGKVVTLKARDQDTNPGEDDAPNMRDGKTNYFIFPGDSGQDPKWLMGKAFKGHVKVTFSHDGANYASAEFELTPHVHGHGSHDHDH